MLYVFSTKIIVKNLHEKLQQTLFYQSIVEVIHVWTVTTLHVLYINVIYGNQFLAETGENWG